MLGKIEELPKNQARKRKLSNDGVDEDTPLSLENEGLRGLMREGHFLRQNSQVP